MNLTLQSTAGSLQSLCWASAAVGGVASAYFSGSLIESYGTRGVFGLTAIFPLVVSLSAVLIDESPASSPRQLSTSFVGLHQSLVHCLLSPLYILPAPSVRGGSEKLRVHIMEIRRAGGTDRNCSCLPQAEVEKLPLSPPPGRRGGQLTSLA